MLLALVILMTLDSFETFIATINIANELLLVQMCLIMAFKASFPSKAFATIVNKTFKWFCIRMRDHVTLEVT